jgi:pyruvate dehydrogenase E2 component (dihydrolipoamide acetyltransferase)
MATAVLMPKAGNSVESCIIVEWKKKVGDAVAVDDALCEVETDKATMEVPSPAAGTLLATLFAAGDDVPVLTTIAWVGEAGEEIGDRRLETGDQRLETPAGVATRHSPLAAPAVVAPPSSPLAPVSPRARHLAERKGVDTEQLAGSGPGGRIIERDVQAALAAQPKLTPVARAMVAEGGFAVPGQGSGPGGRVMAKDLVKEETGDWRLETGDSRSEIGDRRSEIGVPEADTDLQSPISDLQSPISDLQSPVSSLQSPLAPPPADEVETVPVKGVRKVIAERMLQSLQTTAQLTLNASADARALQALRKRLKESPEAMGLRSITINDLVLLAVARTLPAFPGINAVFTGDTIQQHRHVQLGVAVDTSKGLMVPVVRAADTLTLRQLAAEAKRLAAACQTGKALPDELSGGTFTVTNLGAFGIESFTPVLNSPQVAILGVCNIQPKPVEVGDAVQFVPHIGLSLTINHQVVDGAPAARFLQALGQAIAQIDLLLAG